MCRAEKSIFAQSEVKSLKPHCVSDVFTPQITPLIKAKTEEINFLCNFLSTLASYSKHFLDPTTITKGLLIFVCISSIFLHILSNSEKVVAPSASTIRTLCPMAQNTPALTAPPFPLFFGYQTTYSFALSYFALRRATSLVQSFEPSFTTMIS